MIWYYMIRCDSLWIGKKNIRLRSIILHFLSLFLSLSFTLSLCLSLFLSLSSSILQAIHCNTRGGRSFQFWLFSILPLPSSFFQAESRAYVYILHNPYHFSPVKSANLHIENIFQTRLFEIFDNLYKTFFLDRRLTLNHYMCTYNICKLRTYSKSFLFTVHNFLIFASWTLIN